MLNVTFFIFFYLPISLLIIIQNSTTFLRERVPLLSHLDSVMSPNTNFRVRKPGLWLETPLASGPLGSPSSLQDFSFLVWKIR